MGNIPDSHLGAGDGGQLDGTRETLVTLGVVVLQTDLEFDGLGEVTLLLVERVLEEVGDILAHSGCEETMALVARSRDIKETWEERTDCDLRHDCYSLPKEVGILKVWLCAECWKKRNCQGP